MSFTPVACRLNLQVQYESFRGCLKVKTFDIKRFYQGGYILSNGPGAGEVLGFARVSRKIARDVPSTKGSSKNKFPRLAVKTLEKAG
jgi:hypothetical protein